MPVKQNQAAAYLFTAFTSLSKTLYFSILTHISLYEQPVYTDSVLKNQDIWVTC